MIKIRYSDLPAGLHVQTVVQGRHTILYLLPGLSTAERRAAVHRARSNARVGYGPRMPAAGVAFALGADRVRMHGQERSVGGSPAPRFLRPGHGHGAIGGRGVSAPRVGLDSAALAAGRARAPVRRAVSHRAVRCAIRLPGPGQPVSEPGRPGPWDGPALRRGGGAWRRAARRADFRNAPLPVYLGFLRSAWVRPVACSFARPVAEPEVLAIARPSPAPSPLPTRPGLCVQVGPLGVCLKA